MMSPHSWKIILVEMKFCCRQQVWLRYLLLFFVEEKNKEFKSVNIFHTIEEDNICISFFPPPIDYFEDGELESPGIIQLMKQFMVFLFEATNFLYLLTDPKSLTPITHEEWIVGVNGFLDICTDWDQWAILMFKQILAIRKCEPGKTVFHKLGIGNQMCVASKHLEVYFKRCRKGLAVRMRLHWQPRIGCGQGFDCTIQLGSSPINRVIHDDFMHYLNLIVQFLIVTVCDKLQWNVGHVAVKPGAWDAILGSWVYLTLHIAYISIIISIFVVEFSKITN